MYEYVLVWFSRIFHLDFQITKLCNIILHTHTLSFPLAKLLYMRISFYHLSTVEYFNKFHNFATTNKPLI